MKLKIFCRCSLFPSWSGLGLISTPVQSLARPTFRYILFDGENISFDASLVIYKNNTNIPTMIINRIYEHQNLLSLYLVSFLVGLKTYQHTCAVSRFGFYLTPKQIMCCRFCNDILLAYITKRFPTIYKRQALYVQHNNQERSFNHCCFGKANRYYIF